MYIHRTEGPHDSTEGRTIAARSRSSIFSWLSVGALALATSIAARADNNSYAAMLQNNAMWQANLTKQMINLGGVAHVRLRRPRGAGALPAALSTAARYGWPRAARTAG